jgi:DNA-binding cell septation regulator SpoVG
MKIKDFRKLENGGKVKGFMTIVTSEGFEMKNFKLIEGINGLFVGAPSQKGTDKEGNEKWFDIVWVPKELNEELVNLVSNEIDPNQLVSENNQGSGIPF